MIGLALAAAVFAPASANIVITGNMTAGAHANCPFQLQAATNGQGDLTVLSGTFCPLVSATRLPWTWRAHSVAYQTGIASMSLSVDGVDCYWTSVKIADYASGWLLWPGHGPCGLGAGAFETSPKMTVVK